MAKKIYETPMLDELESGPWPSFISGIKKLRDEHPDERIQEMTSSLLGQLEHSYETRKGYWKGGTVSVFGYGGGIIPRFSEVGSAFPESREFHTLRVQPPAGNHSTTAMLRQLGDSWEKWGSGLQTFHGQTGNIMFIGTTTENTQHFFDEINEYGWDLGGAGPCVRTAMSCIGAARCEMSCANEHGIHRHLVNNFTDDVHRPALPYKFKFKVSGCPNDCQNAIERADMVERISSQNVRLRQRNRLLREQRAQIAALQDETEEAFQISIHLLSRAAELHDENTARHVERVNEYSYFLARELGMPDDFCDEIRYSAQLHDAGKMSVNVAVLRKQGPLDDEERYEMMRHPEYGFQILSASDRLKMAAEIALNHHEQWNGGGYPVGRKGEQIPISARIVALADIYDAIRSERPYKPAFTHEQARKILLEGDDRFQPKNHLDPELVDIFAARHEGMAEIWDQFRDQ
jgi:HD-GYP domain-containing protein (c-di-GMP phosphodiesterase class II)